MNQRGSTRRPNTAQKDPDPNRMPFEAAEALLWGKATFDQHQLLYQRMQNLEEQHRAYDGRIQSTEKAAEAAEAATARVRHLEQQVVAIEADERDKPFNNWVTAELSGLKTFVEKNKSVRQKQIDVEKELSSISVDFGRVIKYVSKNCEGFSQRLAELESKHRADTVRIKELEKTVTSLTLLRNTYTNGRSGDRLPPTHLATPERPVSPPPQQVDLVPLDPTEETEDEDLFASLDIPSDKPLDTSLPINSRAEQSSFVDVLSSPTRSKNNRSKNNMSARLRMMLRKSIHEPRKDREIEPTQPREHVLTSLQTTSSGLRKENGLPATQLVTHPHAHIVQRTEEGSKHALGAPPVIKLIVKLPVSPEKRKCEEEAPVPRVTKLPVNHKKRHPEEEQPVPRITRSQARAQVLTQGSSLKPSKICSKIPVKSKPKGSKPSTTKFTASNKVLPLAETQIVGHHSNKRRKLNGSVSPARPGSPVQSPSSRPGRHLEPTQAVSHVPHPVKAPAQVSGSPSKRQRCVPCIQSHSRCDHGLPSCGSCKAHPKRGPCVYMLSTDDPALVSTSILPLPQVRPHESSTKAASMAKGVPGPNPRGELLATQKPKSPKKHGSRR